MPVQLSIAEHHRASVRSGASRRMAAWAVLASCVACACSAGGAAANEPVESPQAVLQSRGLSRSGNAWLSRGERRIQGHLPRMAELEQRILAAERSLKEAVGFNATAWAARSAAEEELARLAKAASAATDPLRKKLQETVTRQRTDIDRLYAQAVPPADLGGLPGVRNQLVELTGSRHELALAIQSFRQLVVQLPEEYERLAADPPVAAALASLGEGHRLGPARHYENELRGLGKYVALVDTWNVPLYREGSESRVGALINDRAPLTFTWRDSATPTVITSNMRAAAGLPAPTGAPTATLELIRGRKSPAHAVTIPYVRFGRCLLRDVAAYVLRPEDEDLGARIGPEAFSGYRVTPQPPQLRLNIEPAE
jgi:hypothetical protein